jgi:hypothetical protein
MSVLKISSKKLVAGLAIPAAVVVSGAMVWQSSYSAFSATTSNPTTNWTSGTVALSDDDSNTAMFNAATNLKPGATGTKCIAVTSTGSLASTVKLYGTSYATTKGLADNINLKVEEGTGATTASCSGFTAGSTLFDGALSSFGTTKTSFANGVSTWAPTGTASETKSYKVTYTLSATTPDSAQGGTAALGFTWESQNS